MVIYGPQLNLGGPVQRVMLWCDVLRLMSDHQEWMTQSAADDYTSHLAAAAGQPLYHRPHTLYQPIQFVCGRRHSVHMDNLRNLNYSCNWSTSQTV